MAKPILVIRIPQSVPEEAATNISASAEKKLKGEYHIMVVRGGGHADRVEFECINGGEYARGKD